MKKLISILLIAVIVISLAITPAFAQETSKFSNSLQEVLDKVDDDCNIKVVVSLINYLDEVEEVKIKVQTDKECGYTKDEAKTNEELSIWLNTNTDLRNEFYAEVNQPILEKMNLSNDELLRYFEYKYVLFTTKERILEISAIEGVNRIYLEGGFVQPDPEHLYEEKLYRKTNIVSEIYEYDEVEYHYNEDGELEWVLIYTVINYAQPLVVYAVIGDRVWVGDSSWPNTGYCIYDVKQEDFFDICSSKISWDDYDGLEEAIYNQKIGRPIGDADRDGQLSVLDATKIQRVLASLDSFHMYDDLRYWNANFGSLAYISDFDRDGERTIMDATAIQFKLAGK